MDNNAYFQSEIHRLLKLGPDLSKAYKPEDPTPEVTPGLPFDLLVQTYVNQTPSNPADIVPQFNKIAELEKIVETMPHDAATYVEPAQAMAAVLPNTQSFTPAVKKAGNKSWTGFLVYPLVFVIAFAVFYGVLNFAALSAQVSSWFMKSEDEVVLQEDLTTYNTWINGYFFAVGDKDKLGPNNDIDLDGLTNLDEFKIKTNPTLADSDGDGVNDGVEVINGTNPWGAGKTTKKQAATLDQTNLIQINNRISFNAAANSGATQDASYSANYDLTQPGRLTIPRLNMQVPLIWTQSPDSFDDDLTKGVVHYPGTALPGEQGMVYISGHSSDYFWKKHPYTHIFAKINALETGDDIFVDVYGKDGKLYNFRYRVTVETVYSPDDQRQFIDNSGAKLNLSTCWPIGTQKDRYVVTAELVK